MKEKGSVRKAILTDWEGKTVEFKLVPTINRIKTNGRLEGVCNFVGTCNARRTNGSTVEDCTHRPDGSGSCVV